MRRQVGGLTRPHRVRVLDLPFTAVEWVLPTELSASLPATPTRWMVWQRSPRAVARVSSGLWDVDELPSGTGTPLGALGAAPLGVSGEEDFPEERLAFALGDGRVGVLAVKGRKVSVLLGQLCARYSMPVSAGGQPELRAQACPCMRGMSRLVRVASRRAVAAVGMASVVRGACA